jgi:transcriptional regulator with XRE-family HTH domain
LFLNIDKFIHLFFLSKYEKHYASQSPTQRPSTVTEQLAALGTRIRARRKALKVSATALAEAAGMSRVSVHRIEQGEPSVTMGAYLNVLAALGMNFFGNGWARSHRQTRPTTRPAGCRRVFGWPITRQLKQLAWQVQGWMN